MLRTLLSVVVVSISASFAYADGYTPWKYNAEAKRHECNYVYTTKEGKQNTQVVVSYAKEHKDYEAYKGWAFYYKDEKAAQPWGRCAVPGNKEYSPTVMYWQQNDKKDGYVDFKKDGKRDEGYCPAPADGKSPFSKVPDPPVVAKK